MESKIVKTAGEYETVVAYGNGDEDKLKALEKSGVKCLQVNGKDGKIDLNELMVYLAKDGISSILIEGGGEINDAALEAGIVNHIMAFVAPKIFGGRDAKTAVEGKGIAQISDRKKLIPSKIRNIEENILLEYDVEN